jgi:hypothetical protein
MRRVIAQMSVSLDGNGLPLFKDLSAPLMLELVQATTYPDGAALHVYRPARQAF